MNSAHRNLDVSESTTNTIVAGWVRNNANHFLKSVIDQEAEHWNDVNLQTWKIATHNIAKRVRDTTQMGFLINHIRRRLHLYSGNTCLCIENRTEPVPVYSVKRNIQVSANVKHWNKSESVRPKHHHQLAEDISPHQPLNIRLQALRMLLNSQLSDVTSCDCWRLVQKHLVESLCDTDTETFQLSLRIHIKLLNLPFHVMREGFLSLMEGLQFHYSRKYHKSLPTFQQGLEFNNPVHHRIIKISHLILRTAKRVSENWVRMGEKYVEEIINIFLVLTTMHTYDTVHSKTILYPFHVFATIDPKAKWCRRWLLCGFGRKMVLSQQSRVIPLLRYSVEEIADYLATERDEKPQKPVNAISKESVKVSVFSHVVNILCYFATYKKGHTFFPLTCKVNDDLVSLPEVLCLLISHLNNSKEFNYINCKIICLAMGTLIQTKECPFISLTDVFMLSLKPMKEIRDKNQNLCSHQIPWHTVNIIEALSKTETGVMFLVEGKSNVECDEKSPWSMANNADFEANCSPLHIIMNYTDLVLSCRDKGLCERPLIPLLRICAMFFKHYDLCSALSRIPLVDRAAVHFQNLNSQIKDKFPSMTEKVTLVSEELCKSLVSFLANVISFPGGLLATLKHDLIILDIVPFLFEVTPDLWKSPQFRRLILLLTFLPEAEDTMKVECSKPLSKVLGNLWNALEDEDAFVRGIERNINNGIKQYMNVIHIFLNSLPGAKILFFEYDGSDDTLMENGCYPISPAELVTIEHSNDPWHKVALLTIQALTRNLDSWLYAEAKFGIEKRLIQVQTHNVSSPIFDKTSSRDNDTNKIVIIDDCSLLCHKILTSSHIVCISKQEYLQNLNTEVLEWFCKEQKTDKKQVVKNTFDDGRNEFHLLLEKSDVEYNADWIDNTRKVFSSSKINFKPNTIVDLVKCVSLYSEAEPPFVWTSETCSGLCALSPEDLLGIRISVRRGVEIGILDKDLPNEHLLQELVQQSQRIMKIERSPSIFKGFEWTLSSVFFFCGGNLEESHRFLNNFVALQVAPMLWPSLAESKDLSHFCLRFSSLVDDVVSADVPFAMSALRMTGVPWGTLCYSWLTQCFWTVFEWNQVCEWFSLCILYPPDITVYFCAALLNFMQPRLLRAAAEEYTWDEFVPDHFADFSVPSQMPFIEKLIRHHRQTVLPKLLQALGIQ